MAVRKISTGKWICECYPTGRAGNQIAIISIRQKESYLLHKRIYEGHMA